MTTHIGVDPIIDVGVDEENAVVPLALLEPALTPRLGGPSGNHVRALARLDHDSLPPVLVHRPTMRVLDGVHRLGAAALRGDTTTTVRYVNGSIADAFVLAVRANVAQGLPLSPAERVAAARQVIASHSQWSDRAIASAVGLSHQTVGIFDAVQLANPTSWTSGSAVTVGRDLLTTRRAGYSRPV